MVESLSAKVHDGLLTGDLSVGLDNIEHCGLTWLSMSVERIKTKGNKVKSLQIILRYTGVRENDLHKVSLDLSHINGETSVVMVTPYEGYREVILDFENPESGVVPGVMDIQDIISEAKSYIRAM